MEVVYVYALLVAHVARRLLEALLGAAPADARELESHSVAVDVVAELLPGAASRTEWLVVGHVVGFLVAGHVHRPLRPVELDVVVR
eukprot:6302311-Pyramimonas_sp.AAC.1